MSQVQLMGLEAARSKMLRARKEFQRAKLQDTAYRGVHYVASHPVSDKHGTFVYRGQAYTKWVKPNKYPG